MLLTVLAFVVALGLLIAIHEYGHYRTAVACGVKVLRFSIGMGRPLLRWRKKNSDTEFVIAALPLGGYVRMLDEREAEVPEQERHLAFNNQPLRSRALIVAAGPAANLLLAVLLYALVNWVGIQAPKALLGSPAPQSLAAQAGLQAQDWVQAVQLPDAGGLPRPLRSFEDLRWVLTEAVVDGQDLLLQVSDRTGQRQRAVLLPLSSVQASEVDAALMQRIGILSPWMPAIVGEVLPDSPAAAAGLLAGDQVLAIDGQPMGDGAQLRAFIRQSTSGQSQQWRLERAGQSLVLAVTPEVIRPEQLAEQAPYGRIGAMIGAAPEMVTVQYGPLEGLWAGAQKTWDIGLLSLKMMGKMLTGQASVKNLSGPLTIADYAGKSASMGLTQYLLFLALISVSLGVLNLLPLPVLDGGHLMYYLWEAVTGRPVSEAWMQGLQRIGITALLLLMTLALFNDLSRLFA